MRDSIEILSADTAVKFLKILNLAVKAEAFPDWRGGVEYNTFLVYFDEIFEKIFKMFLSEDKNMKPLKKEIAKLESALFDFMGIGSFYQKSYQHAADDISVEWFSGPRSDEDCGYILGTRVRIVVATFRAFSIDHERRLYSRIINALDIMGKPRELPPTDNVLAIGVIKKRVKRRWSAGDDLIQNDRGETVRGLLYEFLYSINRFQNRVRDPEAVMFLDEDEYFYDDF